MLLPQLAVGTDTAYATTGPTIAVAPAYITLSVALVENDLRYHSVLSLWHRVFPIDMSNDGQRLGPSDIFTDVYRVYPIEFFAALDLAFWVPFTPQGIVSTGGPVLWEDMQPGHRFLRSIVALSESGWTLTPITVASREERFVETQNYLADLFAWAKPAELARAWSNYLSDNRWQADELFVGHPNNPVIDIAREVLALRLAHPFNVACNNHNWSAHPNLRFPVWVTDEGDSGYRMHNVRKDIAGEAASMSHLIIHGCLHLLFDKSQSLVQLAVSHRRQAMELINDALKCESWNSEYFLDATKPIFGLP